MPRATNLTPETLLAEYPPPIVALANELRAFVRPRLPDAHEVAYGGWRAIGYRHPEAGYLGAIFLFEDCVRFIFEHGHLLPDPRGVLEGATKQTRHVTLAPGGPVPWTALEVAYGGWRAIGYRHPEAGYLGAIFLFEDCVRSSSSTVTCSRTHGESWRVQRSRHVTSRSRREARCPGRRSAICSPRR